MFKEEVETEIDEIAEKIELLKKKFAEKISDKGSEGMLVKRLEDYFKACSFNREKFMAGLGEDMARLKKNLS